jgi:hypothetical protein
MEAGEGGGEDVALVIGTQRFSTASMFSPSTQSTTFSRRGGSLGRSRVGATLAPL